MAVRRCNSRAWTFDSSGAIIAGDTGPQNLKLLAFTAPLRYCATALLYYLLSTGMSRRVAEAGATCPSVWPSE